jgi:hypothetical protein
MSQRAVGKILAGDVKSRGVPHLWDGHASERIADVLVALDKASLIPQ